MRVSANTKKRSLKPSGNNMPDKSQVLKAKSQKLLKVMSQMIAVRYAREKEARNASKCAKREEFQGAEERRDEMSAGCDEGHHLQQKPNFFSDFFVSLSEKKS